MWDEAVKTTVFGIETYTFGLYAALGALLALLGLAFACRKTGLPRGSGCLTGCLMLACGFVFSRIGYCLMNFSLGGLLPVWVYPLVTGGGWSWAGALGGVLLAGVFSGKLLHADKKKLLDALCPAFLLFLAAERVGESCIEDFGISRPLTENEALLQHSFLALEGEYNLYLATWALEAAFCVLLAAVLFIGLMRGGRAGSVTVRFLLVFGMAQTLLESLRLDNHLTVSFVRMQQVLSIVLLICGVLLAARQNSRVSKGVRLAAYIGTAVAVLVGIALEFAIDRTQISRYLLYAVFFTVLLVPTALGLYMNRKRG